MVKSLFSPHYSSLLFDDALTQEKKGFVLTMNPAIRIEEPVLVFDQPWEIGGLAGDSNITVMEDEGIYKLWYVVKVQESEMEAVAEVKGTTGAEKLDRKTLADFTSAKKKYMLCYATSKDGINWERPNLGIVNYKGNTKNNIIFADRLGCTVFKDPIAPSKERYKLIYGGGPRLPHVLLPDNIPVRGIYYAIYGAYSSDGIHWKPYKKPIIPWYTDTTNVCYWDDRIKKYVAFVRWNKNMVYEDGKTVKGEWKYRAIGRTESKNFKSFPPPIKIMEPPFREREPQETGLDYYNTSAVKYPFAADSYFFFYSNFYHNSDMLDVHLATSRDGIHYTRWRNPFVSPGLADAFDSKCIYMATGMIPKEDEIWMYYAGYDYVHGASTTQRSGGVGGVRIRMDGFVSQDAPWSGGHLTTIPLTFKGKSLQVNMDANAGGWLKVELLDGALKPIAGFRENEADFLWGNDIHKTVTWKGKDNLSSLKRKPISLKFIGKGVKLYAFQFVTRQK